MFCPECYCKSDVVDSRELHENLIRRKRYCRECKKRFMTIELPIPEAKQDKDQKIFLIGHLIQSMIETLPKTKLKKVSPTGKKILRVKKDPEPDWDKMTDEEIEKFFER